MHSKIKLYFRGRGRRKILPISTADRENSAKKIEKSIKKEGGTKKILTSFCDLNYGAGINLTESARTLQARYYKGATKFKGGTTGVAIPIQCCRTKGIVGETNYSHTLMARDYKGIGNQEMTDVAIPVLTPDRANKRQNGRRFKENGEPMFTLTAQDRHGVGVNISGHNVIGITDTCNCLNANDQRKIFGAKQGRTMAALKIKEATKQGYAEACEGDSINLSMPESETRRGRVGYQIAQTLDTSCNQGTPIILKGDEPNFTDGNNGIYVEMPEGFMVYAIWYEKEQCYIAIRRLTPKECFRLQGWSDDYYEKAAFVNSDSRLYMQAGNGVTVDVVYAIGKKIAECEKKSLEEFQKHMNKPEKAEQTKGERRWRD